MNSKDRETTHISLSQAKELIEAAAHAFCSGHPFNLFIHMNWNRARLKGRALDATGNYMKALCDWAGGKRSYVWVQENPPGTENAHALVHVFPDDIPRFMELKDGWAESSKIGATPQERGRVICADQIIGSFPEWDLFRYLENLKDCLQYMLKGLEEAHCPALGIDHRNQGVILGKRCSASELLTANGRAKDANHRAENPILYHGRGPHLRQRPFRLLDQYDRKRHLLDLAGFSFERFGETPSERDERAGPQRPESP